MSSIVVAYIPVIHSGYLTYLASTATKKVYCVHHTDVPEFEYLSREIRALSISQLTAILEPLGYEIKPFADLLSEETEKIKIIYMPEDDITRHLQEKHFKQKNVVFGLSFLRWDWSKATAVISVQPESDRVIKKGSSDYGEVSEKMKILFEESKKSSDWWRQVAAMIVTQQGEIIVSYNKHFPHEYSPYMDGDPRDSFKPGEFIEVSTAFHGERRAIAEAARKGIALESGEMYVTTFPCNDCANWIVAAGIRKVFFAGGYANLNGQKILHEHGVEIIYVEL